MSTIHYGAVAIITRGGQATALPNYRVAIPGHELHMYGPEIAARRALSVIFPVVAMIDGEVSLSIYTWPDDGERIEGRCGTVKWDSTDRTSEYAVV